MRKIVLAFVMILVGVSFCFAGSNGDGTCDSKTKIRIEKESSSLCCNTFRLKKGGTIYCMDYHKEENWWRKRWGDIKPPYEIVPVFEGTEDDSPDFIQEKFHD